MNENRCYPDYERNPLANFTFIFKEITLFYHPPHLQHDLITCFWAKPQQHSSGNPSLPPASSRKRTPPKIICGHPPQRPSESEVLVHISRCGLYRERVSQSDRHLAHIIRYSTFLVGTSSSLRQQANYLLMGFRGQEISCKICSLQFLGINHTRAPSPIVILRIEFSY